MENENENIPVEEQETAGETEAQATMGETAAAQETKPVKNELDVFISYSTKNKNVADAVVANFEQHGIRCWYAPRDILPGQEWVSAIKEALHKAKVFVLIYTDESNASRQVMNEVALAFNANKTIVPFRLTEGNMNDELEYYLTRVHWLDAVSKPLERNIEALRNYVETSLNRPASADPTKAAAAAPAAPAPKKEGKKKSKIGLWIGLAVAVIALVACGVFAIPKLMGPKAEDLMEAGREAFYYGKMGTADAAIARENFQKAAEKGVPDAYAYLGLIEEWEYDYKEAKEFYEKGVDAGSNLSKLRLGYLYQRGYGVKADFDKAWKLYNEAADNDCAEADFFRGKVVAAGIAGQEFDYAKALKYYQNVTEESQEPYYVACAYMEMGNLYRKGSVNVPVDYDKALESYQKITEAMDSLFFQACQKYDIALTYKTMEEEVKAEDYYARSYEAYKEMADAGFIQGMYWTGVFYDYGIGKERNYSKAKQYYEQANDAAKELNEKACCYDAVYRLGNMAEYGYGFDKDYNVAYEYYKEAANAGYGKAAGRLGDFYYYGYVGKDADGNNNMELARQWYDKAIEYGNTIAYCNIGNIYDKGTNKIEANAEEAMSWYLKGAAAGSKECMFNIALAYQKKEDYAKALEWFEKSANLGDVSAYVKVAEYYKNGKGTEKNDVKAAEWYLKAAKEDNVSSMYEYGYYMLNGGEGVEINEEEGLKWLTQAADHGNNSARATLGNYYYNIEDYENSFMNYLAMAENGSTDIALFHRLGKMYLEGMGTVKNEEEGIAWLEKAAQSDYQNSLILLGNYYYDKKTYDKAFTYYKRLGDLGNESQGLCLRLGAIYREGRGGVTKDERNAFNWLVKAYEAGAKLSIEEAKFVGYKYYAGDENIGVTKDRLKSLPYYKSAAEDGNISAMVFLASVYQYDSKETTRFEEALKWYGKALDENAKASEDKKLSERNEEFCYDNIKRMVDEGQVTKEAAAKWLQ